MPSEGMCLVVDQVFHDRCWAKFWAEASAPAAKAAPTPVMSNPTGRASASRLALACYCCDRVLAAEARFHDPPLPGLLVADQLRRPPRSFVPVSAHGQGSLRYLPPSKRQSAPAPAKRAVLDCRAEGTCGHERSFGLRRGRGAQTPHVLGRLGDRYDLKNVFDLARYLLRPLPRRKSAAHR